MTGGIDGEIHSKMAKIYWFKKLIRKKKPHSSEESEDKVVEGER